jgi:hypothetical protein
MIRVVRLHFKDEKIEDFKNLFEERKEKIRHFPGCSYLELWQDEHDKAVFYTYSHWGNPSHLEDYRISELFEETWAIVKPWFAQKPMAFSTNSIVKLP